MEESDVDTFTAPIPEESLDVILDSIDPDATVESLGEHLETVMSADSDDIVTVMDEDEDSDDDDFPDHQDDHPELKNV